MNRCMDKKLYQKNLLTGEWEEVKFKDLVAADLEKAASLTLDQLKKFVANKRSKQREATRKWRKKNVHKKGK